MISKWRCDVVGVTMTLLRMCALGIPTYFRHTLLALSNLMNDDCPVASANERTQTAIVYPYLSGFLYSHMMKSSKGSIFCVTGPLWGESTGHRWFPLTKASDAELCCFLRSAPEQKVEQTIETPVLWDAIVLIMASLQWMCQCYNCASEATKKYGWYGLANPKCHKVNEDKIARKYFGTPLLLPKQW